jgi:peptidoglycan hydrolase-like protein with peptidoglycan-binding domain
MKKLTSALSALVLISTMLASVSPTAYAADEVQAIQAKLNGYGCNAGYVDGIKGAQTTAAIKRFQLANPPLAADGIIGTTSTSPTYNKLINLAANYCVNLGMLGNSGTGARFVVSQTYNWVWKVDANNNILAQGGIIDNPVVDIANGLGLAKGTYTTCMKKPVSIDNVHGAYNLYNFVDFCSSTKIYKNTTYINGYGWLTDRGFHQIPVFISNGTRLHDENILGTNVQTSTACIRVSVAMSNAIYGTNLGAKVVVL